MLGGNSRCTEGFMDNESLKRKAAQGLGGVSNIYNVDLLRKDIRVIPDMKFTCNGTIRGLYLAGLVKLYSNDIYPELQIWRNDPTNNVYQLVSSRKIKISPESIGNKVFFYYQFPSQIPFMENDFIGIYQPSANTTLQIAHYDSMNAPITHSLTEFNSKLTTFNIASSGVTRIVGQSLLVNLKLCKFT